MTTSARGVVYWGSSAAVGGALALLFWILQAADNGHNHAAYLGAAIVCTVLGVGFLIVALVRKYA